MVFIGASQVANIVDLSEIFFSSPVIYAILLFLSISSFSLWLYCMFTFRVEEVAPTGFLSEVKILLEEGNYEKLTNLCRAEKHVFAHILRAGIASKESTLELILQTMQSEGKRATASYWQKLSILNDIAVISPMFGLLGTICGMFYAFYDINRSLESIHALFDGLGVAIGTTLLGLIVAISSMVFYALLKQRLIYMLHVLENESLKVGRLISPVTR